MRFARLNWITKAIEYPLLSKKESTFLFTTVEEYSTGKLMTKTTEETLENLFAEVQWREDKDTAVCVP